LVTLFSANNQSFKTRVLSELINPQTSHHPSSFVIFLIYIFVSYPVNRGRVGRERREGTSRKQGAMSQREGEGSRKWNVSGGHGPKLGSREGNLYLEIFARIRVPSYTTKV